MQLLSASSSAAAIGALGTDVSSSIDSVFYLLILAAAIPLAFYVIHQVIGLFPKGRRAR